MSITDILIRSVCGYIFVVPGLLLLFWRLKKSGRKQPPLHAVAVFVFSYYLVGVLTMTGIGKLKAFSPRIVLVPFLDMMSGPVDTLLNIILFVPLGFFLPLLYGKYSRIGRAALAGFLFSLTIEIVQMFGRGSTDINDLITNTVGTCLGFLAYKWLVGRMRGEVCGRLRAVRTRDGLELLFVMFCSMAVMVTIQPYVISRWFKLG